MSCDIHFLYVAQNIILSDLAIIVFFKSIFLSRKSTSKLNFKLNYIFTEAKKSDTINFFWCQSGSTFEGGQVSVCSPDNFSNFTGFTYLGLFCGRAKKRVPRIIRVVLTRG